MDDFKRWPACHCHTFAKVKTPCVDGGWDNTKVIRCVNCTRVYAVTDTRTPSEAVLVEALRQQVRDLDNLTKEYRSVFDVQSPESEILRLQNALRDIAFLRPGGPTRNKLAMQMERIAIDALDALAAAKGERV